MVRLKWGLGAFSGPEEREGYRFVPSVCFSLTW